MATVRCESCGLPYNDANPRGCPRCASESSDTRADMMKQLARASRAREQTQPVTADSGWERTKEHLENWSFGLSRRSLSFAGIVTAIIVVVTLIWATRPSFVEEPNPATMSGAPRPLTILTGQQIQSVFAILGSQPPQTHPNSDGVERYSYGSQLVVDAINGRVYSISFSLPTRSWQGVRPGMNEREVEGRLAVMGSVLRSNEPVALPQPLHGYATYRSLEARPTRTFSTEVRPPNGCYDVLVQMQPRATGILRLGGRRYAVVGREGAGLIWVSTLITIVDRTRRGPIDTAAC